MPKSTFTNILYSTFRNAKYLYPTSIHAIRRQQGKQVDQLYTEVQRSQHLTSAGRISGQSYVANTSSVDGLGAFLGARVDNSHMNYLEVSSRFKK